MVKKSRQPDTNKSLGQHWLNDQPTLQAICDAASLEETDTVLEIGPGPGALTKLLVKRVKQVVAVEFDQNLAEQLHNRVQAANLKVINQDILKFDLTALPADFKVVANIPYYLTSKLIRDLSESTHRPKIVVLLIQKEVAERVAAKPGALSILGVSAQYYWHVNLGNQVPAKFFTPPPKVDSKVLVLQRREEPLFSDVNTKLFFQVVKAGFSSKRKTLLNSISGGLRLSKQETSELLAKAGINSGLRAQELALDDWHELYLKWQNTENFPAPS